MWLMENPRLYSWLKSIKNHKTFFNFIKSETSDSFVSHFDGHFAYLKTLDFNDPQSPYQNKTSRFCVSSLPLSLHTHKNTHTHTHTHTYTQQCCVMANLSSPWSVNLKTKGYPPEHWLQRCAPSKPARSAPAPSYRKDAADSDRLWNDHRFSLVMLLFADEHFSVSLDCGTQHSLHSQLQPLATGKM